MSGEIKAQVGEIAGGGEPGPGICIDSQGAEPIARKPVTGMDVHNLSKTYKERLNKFSKEALLLHLSFMVAWSDLVLHFGSVPGIEQIEKDLKEYGKAARSNNRVKRITSTLKRIEEGTWVPPRKRRKRRPRIT